MQDMSIGLSHSSIRAALLIFAVACGSSTTDATKGGGPVTPPDSTTRDTTSTKPPSPDSAGSWQLIVAGASHTCGLTKANAAYCWGTGLDGQLGNGATLSSPVPVAVTGGLQFKTLALSERRTCGLDLQGQAYCWGFNSEGATSTPTRADGRHAYVQLAFSDTYSCGLTATGAVDCWDAYADFTVAPHSVATPEPFASIAAGVAGSTTCGVAASGALYCWGALDNSQPPLLPILQAPAIRFAAATTNGLLADALLMHTCGLTLDGTAFCWGNNSLGQLGDGLSARSDTAVAVQGGLHFAQIGSTWAATMGLTTDGEVYYWGSWLAVAVKVPTLMTDRKFVRISVGGSHMCGVTDRGAGYCWGDSEGGVFGNGNPGNPSDPHPVPMRVGDPE